MVLDSEPKREPSDVKVQIPSRDTPLKSSAPVAGTLPPPSATGSQASGTITIPSSPSVTATPAEKAGTDRPGADSKGADAAAKAAEKKAAEAKLAEAKLAEAKKAAEARKAAESKSADAKGADSKSSSTKAGEKSSDMGSDKGSDKGSGKAADKGPDKAAAGGKQFLLQAGAFSSEKSASDQAARVKQAGLRAYTEKVKTADGERVRVRVGPFPNREAAEQARGQLKLSGIDSAVIVP